MEADAKREFDFACSQIQFRIDARMDAHAQILTSAAALFDASDEVTREDWHAFTLRQKVEQHLPGIQGIGFALVVPQTGLIQHIQEIRSQGFPDYNVWPEGDRETYTAIIYLEPFSGRNLRAFGYDMFSEPVRRAAMEQAMDSDVAAPLREGDAGTGDRSGCSGRNLDVCSRVPKGDGDRYHRTSPCGNIWMGLQPLPDERPHAWHPARMGFGSRKADSPADFR